jgi:methylated-DNA-[protein]-cysteine S-methyltransferase
VKHAVLDSPVGPLVLVDVDGALAGLYMTGQKTLPVDVGPRDDAALPAAREQLTGYFAGELRDFDLPLHEEGTDFQRRVWAALREVPYGTTCSYAELAAAVGSPTAVRAVGSANGRNRIGVVVPCHRVVGASGALTGYAGGVANKAWLLAHEAGAVGLFDAGAGTLAG